MRFYTEQHQHYCGIDLHARTLYLCILDAGGNVLLHKNLPCDRTLFLEAIEPFREDLVVASECIFNWYWVADLCAEHEFPSSSATLSTCAPSMGARPRTTASTP